MQDRYLKTGHVGWAGSYQAHRQDLAAGGPKTRRGGTFFKYSIGCMQQSGGKRNMGGTDFKWRGRAPLAPPLATALVPTRKNWSPAQ